MSQALPVLRRRRSGHVINISSIVGFATAPGWGIYASTKFAVEGFTETLHTELAPLGIHVTLVEPGFFRTDFLDPPASTPAPTPSTTTRPPPVRCVRPPRA
ncbi:MULTISPECIES: SDR family NAD(P)-dependent oxidoreductase [unclassified Streptomyces]|uniref:SDR family NAD(P)-dependent oxidoreductase n=1 Tax=unclassified Streptomyces TaxID=2593676 RepID=UPI0032494FD1